MSTLLSELPNPRWTLSFRVSLVLGSELKKDLVEGFKRQLSC